MLLALEMVSIGCMRHMWIKKLKMNIIKVSIILHGVLLRQELELPCCRSIKQKDMIFKYDDIFASFLIRLDLD